MKSRLGEALGTGKNWSPRPVHRRKVRKRRKRSKEDNPAGFVTDSDSEHYATFNLQRLDPVAHLFQQKDFAKLDRTADWLGKVLSKSQVEDFLERPTWAIRRWLKTYDPSYAPWRAELRLHRTMERAMAVKAKGSGAEDTTDLDHFLASIDSVDGVVSEDSQF